MSDVPKIPKEWEGKGTYKPDWFQEDPGPLMDNGLPVRFNAEATRFIELLSHQYGISQARVVRILVQRSMKEMKKR